MFVFILSSSSLLSKRVVNWLRLSLESFVIVVNFRRSSFFCEIDTLEPISALSRLSHNLIALAFKISDEERYVSLAAPSALIVALKRTREDCVDMCGLNISSPATVVVRSVYSFDDEASTIHKRFQER